ncbi:PREDICTED: uncharacterized protein LOC108361335 isoform X1 [Rhagoletis zephyria]|uniref:uncharacterized protein LOC108361335 isoform X1 n=1 Tax=Rhagoletis zephyria TaxID=28612 RepID=UPI0008115063|nr:PREDICTED: uncharacterized protein LOC108361335 isoform X1 [Rhagoletis zephyria]
MSNMRKVQRGIRKKTYFLPAETEFLAPATYCNFKRMSIQPTKRSRASGEQLSAMLDFLGENPNVASGKFQKLHGKLENTKKWAEMADKLNSLGGAAKSVEQWQNVWRDLKSRTSTRVRDRKREQALTGNIPLQQPPLNELEKRVIALVGSSYMEGQPDVQENIPMEEELQLTLGAADENFRLVMEEDTMVIPPLTVSDGESEIRCETPKTPRQTPRRTAKRKRAEESPTKAKFLRIAEAQAESEKVIFSILYLY